MSMVCVIIVTKLIQFALSNFLFLLPVQLLRKEYALARSLAVSQAHVLRAHDEIKMATSRLRLRENEDDKSIEALSPEELDTASVENSGEKFLAMDSLSRIKGQLRYLKVATKPCFLAAYAVVVFSPSSYFDDPLPKTKLLCL